eukprot:CAMPEP_0185831614 /NCGR_PEP_ID=MMETSP1353-20130828/1589_1 /TAXON_ID=1077150 /ORGANISM="Erythrolobus australicus, Strain CCMP3124" /LENGTH=333 /DNA_ID=CAMNT_0028529693 /DNA_START=79 /DNA_END=1080 /DNA_ORIENTATION=+
MAGARAVALATIALAFAAVARGQTCCQVAEFDACLLPSGTPGRCETATCSGYVEVPCAQSSTQCTTITGHASVGSPEDCSFTEMQFLQPNWAASNAVLTSWGWNGPTGPANWGLAFETCRTGTQQSPIDIIPGSAAVVAATAAQRATLGSIASHGPATYVTAQSKGAPKYDCAVPQSCGSVTYNGKTYYVLQFHMHAFSENGLNGQVYPMEFHFVHISNDNELLVVGVLMDITSAGPNAALQSVLDPAVVASSGTEITFDPSALYDGNAGFYNWAGSLTTPPCSEGVTWVLSKSVMPFSENQWQTYWDHIGGYPGNARDFQPLNGRTILDSTP